MLRRAAFAAVLIFTSPALAGSRPDNEINFVSNYIRALSDAENIRVEAMNDLKTAKSPMEKFSSCLHTTQLQIDGMAEAANLAAQFHFAGESKDTPGLLVTYYATKGSMFMALSHMCEAVVEGPKPGVDFGKIAADMPKLRADMEQTDKNLLLFAPLVFSTLISRTPDQQGHMSLLTVSRKDRDQLVHQITGSFKDIDAKDATFAVASASILRDYLAHKGYKCADEPT